VPFSGSRPFLFYGGPSGFLFAPPGALLWRSGIKVILTVGLSFKDLAKADCSTAVFGHINEAVEQRIWCAELGGVPDQFFQQVFRLAHT